MKLRQDHLLYYQTLAEDFPKQFSGSSRTQKKLVKDTQEPQKSRE